MTSIDDVDQVTLRSYADKFFRLTAENKQLSLKQLAEYVSQMLSVELTSWHRDTLASLVLERGGVRDKNLPDLFNMPEVRKRGGASNKTSRQSDDRHVRGVGGGDEEEGGRS